MKSILTLAVLAAFVSVPALAAEQSHRLTKGGKSYQSTQNWSKKPAQGQIVAKTAQPQDAGDVSNIEPAAGGNAPAETYSQPKGTGKSFREDMRLPRKN